MKVLNVNIECLFNSYQDVRIADGEQGKPDNLDLSSFSVLDSANQPQISGQRAHTSAGPWSSSNTDSLIAGLSIASKPETLPAIGRSTQVNSFPQLNHHIP